MARHLERLDTLLRSDADDDAFRAYLRETVHDYRPSARKVVALADHHKASKHL